MRVPASLLRPSLVVVAAAGAAFAASLPTGALAAVGESRDTMRVEVHLSRPQASIGMPAPVRIRFGGPGVGREAVVGLRVVVRSANAVATDAAEGNLSEDMQALRTSDLSVGQDGVVEVRGDLHDWAVLAEPGRYEVVVTHEAPGTTPIGAAPMLLTVERRRAAELTKQFKRVSERARDARVDVRRAGIRELGYLANQESLPLLVEALYDDDALVARWAAASLSRLPDRLAVRAALRTARRDQGLSGPLVAALFRAGERVVGLGNEIEVGSVAGGVRERRRSIEAAGVVGRLAPENCAEALLPVIRRAVGDHDQSVVGAAFDAFGGWRDAASREALRVHLTPGPTLETGAETLARRRDPEARALLLGALRHRDVGVRTAAAKALWHVGDRSGRGVFITVLRARDAAGKQALMQWLKAEMPIENTPPPDEQGSRWWAQIVERMP